ncbi:MAG TPA: hypothetical protein VLD63_06255 [Anaerolineales bacterium]|nr:hypothetical protein [Anaerolineales bacterium]
MSDDGRTVSLPALTITALMLLAACLRFTALGDRPIGPEEAAEALAAAQGTSQSSIFYDGIVAQPTSALYHILTRVVFTLGGAGEGAARAVPAVAGLVPVVVLLVLRRRIGAIPLLFMALWIAISPAWLATARAAGGTALSLAAFAVAAAVLFTRSPSEGWTAKAWLSLCVGIGVASGPGFLTVVLALFLARLGSAWLGRGVAASLPNGWTVRDLAEVGLWSIAIAAAIASGLGAIPSGLEVLFSGLRAWLTAWFVPGSLPLLTSILLLAGYEPLVLILGIVGVVQSFRRWDPTQRFLVAWVVVSLALFLGSVGRQPQDAIWPLLPLGFLAAQVVQREVESADKMEHPWVAAGLWAALMVLSGFVGQQLAAYLSGIGPGADVSLPGLRLPIALGAIALAGVVVVLVGFGWDWATARAAGVGAVFAVLLALTVSASWRLNLSGDFDRTAELWRPRQGATGLVRLRRTLESLALSQTGTQTFPISVVGPSTPSLAWALRGFPAYVPDETGPGRAPLALIQREVIPLAPLPAKYLGQSMSLGHAWGWGGSWPPDLVRWWLRGDAPLIADSWVLYVREDVATLSPTEPESAP